MRLGLKYKNDRADPALTRDCYAVGAVGAVNSTGATSERTWNVGDVEFTAVDLDEISEAFAQFGAGSLQR